LTPFRCVGTYRVGIGANPSLLRFEAALNDCNRRRVHSIWLTAIAWWCCAPANDAAAQRVQFPSTVPGAVPPATAYPATPAPALNSFPAYDPYANPALGSPPADIPYAAPPPAYGVPYTAPAPAPIATTPAMQMPSFQWVQDAAVGIPRGGFYGGFDGTILEARPGGTTILTLNGIAIDGNNIPAAALEFNPDYDYEFAPRVFGGYKGPGGLGIRGRWWYYDHASSGNFTIVGLQDGAAAEGFDIDLSTSLSTNLYVNSIDLEATQDGKFHNWDIQLAGGVRYAEVEYGLNGRAFGTIQDIDPPPPPPPVDFDVGISTNTQFEGVGPTIALAARRPLRYVDGLAFLMNFRTAFLFGDTDSTFSTTLFPNPVSINAQENVMQVWEVQIGFDYGRSMQNGARLFGGAYLEAQVWEWSNPVGLGSSDLGFFGPTFTVGIAR
jgi:hypothetical protein